MNKLTAYILERFKSFATHSSKLSKDFFPGQPYSFFRYIFCCKTDYFYQWFIWWIWL